MGRSGGGLPWHCPEDLRHFRRLTWGHPVIMGRRTFESIGRPLPGRTNIVLSRTPRPAAGQGSASAVHWCTSAEQAVALARAAGKGRVFVIGGLEVFEGFWPQVEAVYHSLIEAPDAQGDLYFDLKRLEQPGWLRVRSEPHPGFRLDVYERKR